MVSSMCNLCNICLNGSNPSFLQLSLVVIHRSGNVTCVDAKKILLTFHHCHPLKQQKDEENIGCLDDSS